jgi:NAD-dependent deacetylase
MEFTSDDLSQLHCPACKRWLRPHILWFDENYNEEYYHLESVINEMELTDLLLVVGTSLATGLPHYMVERAFKRNVPVIFINPEKTDVSGFSRGNSFQIAESSSIALPKIYSILENSLAN